VAAACATGALAGGLPGPGNLQAPDGVTTGPAGMKYAAVRDGTQTRIEKRSPETGEAVRSRTIPGRWGIPLVSYDGRTEGVSRDGTRLIVGDATNGPRPRSTSKFLILSTRTLAIQRRIVLRGDFAFDTVSPGFRTLFLIEARTEEGGLNYVVRAYDLRAGRLRPQPVRDPRSHEWLMQGMPITRAASSNGAWAYTLYAGGPHAFVHALDSVHGTAACIDLPWKSLTDRTWQLRASAEHGRLVLRRADGTHAAVIDTRKLRVVRAAAAP
jgi:hypothetical protein